jgi:tetratricopeptide (TPR) repeat protein
VSLADTEGRLGNWLKARELLKDARACFLKLNQGLRAATCLKDMADSLRLQGNFVAAGEVLAEAQAEFRSLGARRSEIDCIQTMGKIEFAAGNNKAAALCQEAKNEAKDMGYSYSEAQSTSTLGEIAQAQKEYETAKKWFEEAKVLFEQLELQINVRTCTLQLGLIAFDTGDPQEGDRLVGEAKDLTLHCKRG